MQGTAGWVGAGEGPGGAAGCGATAPGERAADVDRAGDCAAEGFGDGDPEDSGTVVEEGAEEEAETAGLVRAAGVALRPRAERSGIPARAHPSNRPPARTPTATRT